MTKTNRCTLDNKDVTLADSENASMSGTTGADEIERFIEEARRER